MTCDSDVVKRLNQMERAGALGLLRSKVAKPVAVGLAEVGVALLRPFPRLYRHAGSWLSMHNPRIRSLFSWIGPDGGLKTHSDRAQSSRSNDLDPGYSALTQAPTGLHRRAGPISIQAALDNAARHQLLLPPEVDKHLWLLQSASEPEELESVTRLDQMRRSVASVCFIITVDRNDPEALARSVQSVLRQTDPTWEIILCGCVSVQDIIAEWLDIDWRIRRLLPGGGNDEVQNLLQASYLSTSQFVGHLAQGGVVDDDLVKHIGQHLVNDPKVDLVYTDEAAFMTRGLATSQPLNPYGAPEQQDAVHLVGRFLAIRKPLLLNLRIPRSGSRKADEYALGRAVSLAAQRVGQIKEVHYVRTFECGPPQESHRGN